MLSDIFAPIAVFGSLFGICYIYFITRNRERMAMIEKGIGAELFNTTSKPKFTFWALKIGMLLLGIGVGLMIVVFISPNIHNYFDKMAAYWAFTLTFGGLGLVFSFIIERILLNKQK